MADRILKYKELNAYNTYQNQDINKFFSNNVLFN